MKRSSVARHGRSWAHRAAPVIDFAVPSLFFAFRDEHKVDRDLLPRPLDRVERGEECGLRPLLIYRAAPDEDPSESGLVNDRGGEGRRRPFRRIGLLYVVHEVDRDGGRSTRIERGENARVTVGVDTRGLLEALVASETHHQI